LVFVSKQNGMSECECECGCGIRCWQCRAFDFQQLFPQLPGVCYESRPPPGYPIFPLFCSILIDEMVWCQWGGSMGFM